MSKSVKIRRGTELEHSLFVGAEGEITVDTTNWTVRVHNGQVGTPGGFRLLNAELDPEILAEEFKANKILYKNSYASVSAFPTASSYPGMVAFAVSEDATYVSDGTTWRSFTQASDLVNFVEGSVNTSNQSQDFAITAGKSGTNLVFKTLREGEGVTLSQDASTVTISSNPYTAQNVNNGTAGSFGLFKDLTNNQLSFKSLRLGSGLSVSSSTNELAIDTVLKNAFNSVVAGGNTLTTTAGDNILTFTAGTGITITSFPVSKTLDIAVNLSGVNNVNQSGSNVFQSYSNGVFNFNKLAAGAGITLGAGTNGEVVISNVYNGTVTGAENLSPPSPTSLGIYKEDANGVLKFYNIEAGSNVSISYNGDGKNLIISAATGGAAGVGTVQSGIQGNMAFYPMTGTEVGDITDGCAWDNIRHVLITNVDGTVSSLSNHNTDDLAEGSNLYYTQGRFNTAFANKSTADLAEGGTNLYFTDERAQDAVNAMLISGNPTPTVITATTTAVSSSIGTVFVASTSGITVGMTVTGATVVGNVTVQSVAAGQFTVSPAIYAPTGTSITLTGGTTLILNTTAAATSTATLTVNSSSNISNTMTVSGTGILGGCTVQSVPNSTTVVVTPGYNVTVGNGIALSFTSTTSTGVLSAYTDSTNTYTYRLDNNYINAQVRNALSVISGQGLAYDPQAGRFSLSGSVTSVNGYSGAVQLTVSDISGAAPSASPVLTGTPRAPTPTVASVNTQISTKEYVDNAKSAILGSPLAGLTTLQALGNAINGDTLFYQTVQTGLNSKVNTGGGTITGPLQLTYTIDGNSLGTVAVTKQYVDQISTVQSVNTKTANVVLVTDDIAERAVGPAPVNLWFTSARARSAVSLTSNDTTVLSYNVSTGAFTYSKPNTDKVAEGLANLYFSQARARQSISLSITGDTSFASYDNSTGVLTVTATTDNIAQGVTNKFYQDSLARAALTLSTSNTQTSLITYNSSTGQFTVNARTGNITESAGGPYFFTNARVYSALSVSNTQLDNVSATNSLTFNSSTGVFTFNANTNSITEGSTNKYYTDARARGAISISTTDATVLDYDPATGAIAFVKPSTDKIAEGSTNKYYTDARARGAVGVTVTTTTGVAAASHVTYSSSTGTFTVNANIDSMSDGATNKFASIARVAGIISLTTTTNNGATPGAFLAYNNTNGTFTFNNSTDSLTEGTVNKWASDATVRGKISVTNTTSTTGTSQSPLRWGGTAGIAGTNAVSAGVLNLSFYTTPSILWNPTADGTSSYHLATAQDITSTGKPKFTYVTKAINPASGRIALVTNEANCDCSVGTYHEINRNANISNLTFTNVPASGQYLEVTVCFYLSSGNGSFTVSNAAIHFAGATPPTLTSTVGRRDVMKFYTIDGGSNWYELSRSLNIA